VAGRYTTTAVLLRRTAYGDSDLILTVFSRDRGKLALMAKGARKSRKRFAGLLEVFSNLQLVVAPPRSRGMAMLAEAEMVHPFPAIRQAVVKTAYASYWSEIVNLWLEEEQPLAELYALLVDSFSRLNDVADGGEGAVNVWFQIRFVRLAGLLPNLVHCDGCRMGLQQIPEERIAFDLARCGLVCQRCRSAAGGPVVLLSKGTIKQLLWLAADDHERALRVKLSALAVIEGAKLLERFVPRQLSLEPRSLKVLRQIRR
jgi:DNA repair protein RecO (recombination protein O)